MDFYQREFSETTSELSESRKFKISREEKSMNKMQKDIWTIKLRVIQLDSQNINRLCEQQQVSDVYFLLFFFLTEQHLNKRVQWILDDCQFSLFYGI